MKRNTGIKKGFTLVELLVVIGIIALLISILLPALNKARGQANAAKCMANLRSIGQAAFNMSVERKGFIQTVVDDAIALKIDPQRSKFIYRPNDNKLADFASAYTLFLNRRPGANFQDARKEQIRLWECPGDRWLDQSQQAGYKLYNNVTPATDDLDYFRISYGVNADICVLNINGVSAFTSGSPNSIFPIGGPPPYAGAGNKLGQALGARLDKVYKPAEVLLFADCGVRPPKVGNTNVLDASDLLYITSNYQNAGRPLDPGEIGTLAGSMKCDWLGNKFPLDRHGGKLVTAPTVGGIGKYAGGRINVCFADGHAETVALEDFKRVRVSPFNPANYR